MKLELNTSPTFPNSPHSNNNINYFSIHHIVTIIQLFLNSPQIEADSVDEQNDAPTRMPFSELRYLDLSHNLVCQIYTITIVCIYIIQL